MGETLFSPGISEVAIFDMSELDVALFNRIDIRTIPEGDTDRLNVQCLNLLLKLMETEIAFSCGYDSLSSFYKDFKDIFSMTPKMFKQRKA